MNETTQILITTRDAIMIIIGFALGIVSKLLYDWLSRWIKTESKEKCSFPIGAGTLPHVQDIIVTKKFGKPVYVNCGLFNNRDIRTVNGIRYKICGHGKRKTLPDGKTVFECPFDVQRFPS